MATREGKLMKVDTGRWAIKYDDQYDYEEITSGEVFEIQILGVWHKVRMESRDRGYYSVPSFPLKEGLGARNNIWR